MSGAPPLWQRGHAVTALQRQISVLALRASTVCKGNMPRPPRRSAALGLQRCALPLPCSPPAFPSAPHAGLPEGKSNFASACVARLKPALQRTGQRVRLRPSRPSPGGRLRRPGRNRRRRRL